MARKHTKKEAKERLRSIPSIPIPPLLRRTPVGRTIGILEKGSKLGAEVLVELDPLGRLASEPSAGVAQIPLVGTGSGGRFTNIELAQARRRAALQDIVNDPMIKMTPEDLEVINDDTVIMLDDGNIAQIMPTSGQSRQFERQNILPPTKQKRKRSKYNIELSKQLKQLRRERPRTPVTRLMKLAHSRTRKALK